MGSVVGIFAVIILLIVAPAMFMSADRDAYAANITNSTYNEAYHAGSEVIIGWLGFDQIFIAVLAVIVLSIVGAMILRK